MDWFGEKSFDLASQSATQFMSLAVGVLALIAASNLSAHGRPWQKRALAFAWMCYFVSFFAGMWYLLAVTGTVAMDAEPGVTYGVVKSSPRTLQSQYGEVVFEAAPTLVAVREIRRDANGAILRISKAEEPSVWADNLRLPMFIEIFAFGLGSIAVGMVFMVEIASLRSKSTQVTAA